MNTYLFSTCINSKFVFILICLFSFSLTAQNSWVGGMPGQENAWNQARNWSQGHVPDWSDEIVIIPNVSSTSGFYPIIETAAEEIPALLIEGGAELTILANGVLNINGETTHNHGLINLGTVKNDGSMSIVNTSLAALNGKGVHDLTGIYTVGFVQCDDNQFRLCIE